MIHIALLVLLIAMPSGVSSGYQDTNQPKVQKSKNNKGLTDDEVTFIEAARSGDNETVKRFLAAGMDANLLDKRDDELSTVLMVAAMAGKTDTSKLLLANGARVNDKTKLGRTALTWASWRGMTDTVKALLGAGADVNSRDKRGVSPLNYAVQKGRTETVLVLLNAGANPNFHHTESGQTALIDAVMRGYIDIVRVLLEHGADVNDQDQGGRKPVDWARRTNRVEIETLLRKAAAK
jgi:uncharacterized protein